MKLVTFMPRPDAPPQLGCEHAGRIVDLAALCAERGESLPGTMLDFIRAGDAASATARTALAAQWLGLKTALPCHYIDPDCPEVREFNRHLAAAKRAGKRVPKSVVLKPGEWLDL